MSNTTKLLISSALIGLIVLAFGAGFFVRSLISAPAYPDGLDKVAEVWTHVQKDYVDQSKVSSENLSSAAIEGILKYLDDPYSAYLDTASFEFFDSRLSGNFEGIGAYVSVDEDGQIVIVSPIPGSPADNAGIKAGDIILGIDGVSSEGLSLAEAIAKIRGEKGTTVTLSVLHEGDTEPVELVITRDKVEVSSVSYEMIDNVAHIVIVQFDGNTSSDMTPVIETINNNPDITGIVLDLRGNSGGLLDTVIGVASHFITSGVIVEVKSNVGTIASYDVDENIDTTTALPMVVLVDEYSASGSEVLAGALQDYDRAVIAGTTTYGKGSVNLLYELDDGSGLYLTIARWITPDGRIIEGEGIEPDIPLDVTGEEELAWAVEYVQNLQ